MPVYKPHLRYFCTKIINMKKWIFIAVTYMVLVGMLAISMKTRDAMEEKWKTAEANVKAYDNLLGASEDENVAYQLTIDQLNYAKDTLLVKLNEARKQAKVKDKNLKSVQYIRSTFVKVDTLVLNDTVFKDRFVSVDTLVGDDWYKADVKLEYPSTIIIKPEFRSEKSIIVSTKKETVNPPKKFWLLRLLQKKHKVLQVNVVENNPYTVDRESRYVEIIK